MVLFLSAAAVSVSVPILWWAIWGGRSRAATARGLLSDLGSGREIASAAGVAKDVGAPIRSVRSVARMAIPDRVTASVERKALLAGIAGGQAIDGILATKFLGAVLGLIIGLSRASSGIVGLVAVVILPGLGYLAPDLALSLRGRQRQARIRLALADTLDQITVSVEAGLGFEAAMARTSRAARGPLAEELLRTLQDVQAGMSRAEAMRRLADRTDVSDLRHFVLAMRQAEDYGVPVAQVLRIQARELRMKRRQSAEERAMKLPVKMIFPLIFCILPALFIVLLGPGAIRFARTGLGAG